MPINRTTRVACAAALTSIMLAAHSTSAYVNVLGGPTYTPGVGGFKDGYATGVNNSGIAIGIAYMFDVSDSEFGGDPAGYNTWRAHFGKTSGSGLAASENPVPEPISLALLTLAMHALLRRKYP